MEAATEPTMVPGFRHVPGAHCGSTALRNLLAFHGVECSEELVLGLGAGACFFYVTFEDQSPSRFTNGRAARLEQNFLELTGAGLAMETEEDPEAAWEIARRIVDEGRPAILLTDLYHLDHYGRSAHFPGHAVVLAGYDREVAYLSDTGFEQLQTTTLPSLALARHEQHPAQPLAGDLFHIPGRVAIELRDAVPAAVQRAVDQMVDPELGELQGLPALRRFAAEVGRWPEHAQDWRWCARFGYQVIERRGTGGGNFRTMYARFLHEVGYEQARLATEAAEDWTSLAVALLAASEADEPEPELWERVAEDAARVLDAEERLWTALAAGSAPRTSGHRA